MRVLGVDPGSWNTGWGYVDGPARLRLLDCGVIRLRGHGEFPERLARLRCEVELVIERHRPEAAAVEAPFHGASARSALQLAQARGVILAALAGAGIPVAEWTPATVKKAVTDNGRADKDQVRAIVCRQFGLAPDQPHDLTDALAVALCHVYSRRFLAAVERARGGL